MFTLQRRGFSLIEVLIAVVVLSIGLLALAAFQSNLIRSSSENKAQSTALGLAQQQMESVRNSIATGGFNAVADATGTAVTIGNASYTPTTRVERYVFRKNTGVSPCNTTAQFVRLPNANDTSTSATIAALNSCYDTAQEFKRVEVNVGWTDATNVARSVVVSDIISSTTAADSKNVSDDSASGSRGPQTRINDPSSIAGVIPIAVGTDNGLNQSVAATDPKPESFGTGGKVSTNFTVQTYVQDTSGFILQKNFETAVISCRCTTASGTPSTGGPYSPAYWDGDKFTTPTAVTGKAWANVASGVAQDDLCTTCCRDHHDKSAEQVVFDPFRSSSPIPATADHDHYRRVVAGDGSTTFTIVPDTTSYDEACRLVRVDGVFRVTTDPQLENVVVLNTTGTVSDPIIDNTTKTAYSNFAKDYITSIWNAVKNAGNANSAQSSLTDYTPTPTDGLSQVDPVGLVGANVQKQLSSRAIFFDWLSPEAIAKLKCAGATTDTNCQSDYPAYVSRSVHQIFPFLTVNLTGLGNWTESSSSAVIRVTNEAIPTSSSTAYSRGKITSVAAGSASATVSSLRGPAGLADQVAISPHDNGTGDTRVPMADSRGYTVTSATSTSLNKFVVLITNPANDANLRTGEFMVNSTQYACRRGDSTTSNDDPTSTANNGVLETNEHLCSAASGELTATLTFSNYNFEKRTCSEGKLNSDKQCQKGQTVNADWLTITPYDYKLCSIVPSSGTGSVSVSTFSSDRTNSADMLTEYTTVTLTAPSDSVMNLNRFTANFYPEASTCP